MASSRAGCAFKPCLQREDVPQLRLPLAPTGKMLAPFFLDCISVKISLPTQPGGIKDPLRPIAELVPQPLPYRNREPCFWSFSEFRRYKSLQHLTQRILTDPISYFH